jgi:hypothetical protein
MSIEIVLKVYLRGLCYLHHAMLVSRLRILSSLCGRLLCLASAYLICRPGFLVAPDPLSLRKVQHSQVKRCSDIFGSLQNTSMVELLLA